MSARPRIEPLLLVDSTLCDNVEVAADRLLELHRRLGVERLEFLVCKPGDNSASHW
jgi:hypothetical protein